MAPAGMPFAAASAGSVVTSVGSAVSAARVWLTRPGMSDHLQVSGGSSQV